jgi:hypothetical protein
VIFKFQPATPKVTQIPTTLKQTKPNKEKEKQKFEDLVKISVRTGVKIPFPVLKSEKKNIYIIMLWVRTSYDDLHGEFGVAEDREQSQDAGDDVGQDDGGAGVFECVKILEKGVGRGWL